MRKFFIPLLFLVIAGLTVVAAQNRSIPSNYSQKLGQALFYINSYYLDTVNNEKITDEALKAMLLQLDPHSSYIPAKDVEAANEPLEGNFDGIGIEFSIIRDTLTVVAPVSGGPSERVGIRAGDKIVVVNGENIASVSLTNERVYNYLRGSRGTRVDITVFRRGELLQFEVVRDRIPINSVDAAYEVEPGIVYVKLSRFAARSANEIITSIFELGVEKIDGFILDLRDNSGGYLGSSIEIANFFLSAGQTIVYTEGLRAPSMNEKANGLGFYKEGKLAVLIDEGSASASEIVAGAIQDWDRGVIIGRRSFGKGLVQQMLPMSDGSQLRLTVARYHTPSGRVIQSPYESGAIDKYYQALADRYIRGERFSADSVQFPDSLKYKTLIEGRTVYGGGGIMPDIFVPVDTTYYTDYYGLLLRRGIVQEFTTDRADAKRDEWSLKYGSFDTFERGFVIDDEFINELVVYAESKGVKPNTEELLQSKDELSLYMKALVGRNLFGTTAYFRVVNAHNDHAFEKALEYLKK